MKKYNFRKTRRRDPMRNSIKSLLRAIFNRCLKAYYGVIALLFAVGLTSCDGHKELPDTSMKIGHVLCTDGEVLSLCDFRESDKEPYGIVFYINHDPEKNFRGFAVALDDIGKWAFSDTLGISQGTTMSLTDYDGNENTASLFGNRKQAGSPMAEAVFAMWKYEQSAYVPSVAQMAELFAAKERINPRLQLLGGSPLLDEPDHCWFWTSTEVDGQSTNKAWLYSVASGTIHETPKNQEHYVRPVVTIY